MHLPQLDLTGRPAPDRGDLARLVDAARDLGFVALGANDHLTFARPWTDGLVLLAAAAANPGDLQLMTSVALPVLRGVHQYAGAVRALDGLSPGRVVAGVGPGSSPADYALAGVDWAQRWPRFDAAVRELGPLLAQSGVPLWLGSWGSPAGLRRVAEHADGWLASALHSTPASFGAARGALADAFAARGRARDPDHALVTMWTWITDSEADAEGALDLLGGVLGRDPHELRGRLCVGPPARCAELLNAYAERGCRRVHFWPLGDEVTQLRRLAGEVLPRVSR